MKTLLIPTISKQKLEKKNLSKLKKLPKNIAIAYSIQYINIAKQIKQILSKTHNITGFIQVLGCSKPKFPKQTRVILLISDGKFHAASLAYETKLSIYLFDNTQLIQITKKQIESFEKKQKASYLKYLHADKIGILVSIKPGQQNLKKALEFKKNSKKQSYIFLTNNINTTEFENFGLDSYINTACLRLDFDNASIVNVDRIN